MKQPILARLALSAEQTLNARRGHLEKEEWSYYYVRLFKRLFVKENDIESIKQFVSQNIESRFLEERTVRMFVMECTETMRVIFMLL